MWIAEIAHETVTSEYVSVPCNSFSEALTAALNLMDERGGSGRYALETAEPNLKVYHHGPWRAYVSLEAE